VLGASGLFGWGAARAMTARIRRNPDPFPRERLMAEPEGELRRKAIRAGSPAVFPVRGWSRYPAPDTC